MQKQFLTIICFVLTIGTVCANPEGDKFRKSFDAYSNNYGSSGRSHCEILNLDCNLGRLEILQIVADQARTYLATPEAASTSNGKLAEAVIELNNVEHAFYRRLAKGPLRNGNDLQPMIDVQKKLVAVLMTERDEAFKQSIQ